MTQRTLALPPLTPLPPILATPRAGQQEDDQGGQEDRGLPHAQVRAEGMSRLQPRLVHPLLPSSHPLLQPGRV